MSGLSNKVGRYRHADGMRRDVVFEGGRTFVVLVASAYDAGVVGSEYNGIAILDADNNQVVLDMHVRESSGSGGPTAAQKAEFERILTMDWNGFRTFVKGHPRYRGSVPDIDMETPEVPDLRATVLKAATEGKVPGLPGETILTPEMIAADEDPSVPYSFPLRTKADIAAHLAAHEVHGDQGDSRLAWNIKVYRADPEEAAGTEAFDGLWKAYVEKRGEEVFGRAAEDALRVYLDGDATGYFGEEGGKFKFTVGGRQGGWLELESFDGRELSFRRMGDLVDALLEMDDADLARLYVGVETLDRDIRPSEALAEAFGFLRECKEEEWDDPDFAEAEAVEFGVEGWSHPSRNAAPTP